MRFRLYCRLDGTRLDAAENEGFDLDGVRGMLRTLAERGHTYDAVDTTALTSDELMDGYVREAAAPAVYRKYRVRQVFGSRKEPGWLFGNGVPALAVYQSDQCTDVYPHEDAGGQTVTIRKFLEDLAGHR